MAKDGQDAQDAQDAQDTRELIGNDANDPGVEAADNPEASASKSYRAKEAEESINHKIQQEESSVPEGKMMEGNERAEAVEKDERDKQKSVDSREVEAIGTEDSEEVNKLEAAATEEGIEDREVEAGSEPTLPLDDVNANVEMPAIAKDLAPGNSEKTETVVSESAPTPDDPEQDANEMTDPAMRKAAPAPDQVNKGKRTQEPERKADPDATSTPVIQPTQPTQPPMPRTVGKIGWNGRKSVGIEDPHGVQEVLDELPLWPEESLRANYPTTTAYRVAIKKRRYTTIGNTIFLIFCTILLVGVVGSLTIYFAHNLSISSSKTSLPAGTIQEARPTTRALGAETTAPTSNGRILAGYQWIQSGTKHELYIDDNNHIQELASSDGQNWQITDLTERSGAAVANGRTLAGFEWQHGGSELVAYVDAKRHVQLLSSNGDGQWDVMDLTRKAQAPLANGTAITGYEWTPSGSEQVVYIDQRGHIQELASGDGHNWRISDLTALTKAPQAHGNVVAAHEWDKLGSKQVDYIDINQHVQELSFIGGSWYDTDLNSLVGAPLASDKALVGYQWLQTGASLIGYLDTNNHIQLLSSSSAGNWNLVDLTLLVKAPPTNGDTLAGYEWQQGGYNVLYFIDDSNHIQEISDAPGENWQLADLNQFTLSAPTPNGKVLFGYAWAQHGSKQVVYIDTTNKVQELTYSNGKWELSKSPA